MSSKKIDSELAMLAIQRYKNDSELQSEFKNSAEFYDALERKFSDETEEKSKPAMRVKK